MEAHEHSIGFSHVKPADGSVANISQFNVFNSPTMAEPHCVKPSVAPSERYLEFLHHVSKFKQLFVAGVDYAQITEAAADIFRDYITANANFNLMLEDSHITAIERTLKTGVGITPQLFEHAEEAALKLIIREDEYPAFVRKRLKRNATQKKQPRKRRVVASNSASSKRKAPTSEASTSPLKSSPHKTTKDTTDTITSLRRLVEDLARAHTEDQRTIETLKAQFVAEKQELLREVEQLEKSKNAEIVRIEEVASQTEHDRLLILRELEDYRRVAYNQELEIHELKNQLQSEKESYWKLMGEKAAALTAATLEKSALARDVTWLRTRVDELIREKAAIEQRLEQERARADREEYERRRTNSDADDERRRRAKWLEDLLRLLQMRVHDIASGLNELREEVKRYKARAPALLEHTVREILQAFAAQTARAHKAIQQYQRESAMRKKLHNKIVEARGNIRVYCRVRPPTATEMREGGECIAYPTGGATTRLIATCPTTGRRQQFEFDRVFDARTGQRELFRETKELITSVVDGYNVCIFAYGATGSGKTYTMEGPESDPGVNTRALRTLFDIIRRKGEREGTHSFSITVSIVEIYNEKIRDLMRVTTAGGDVAEPQTADTDSLNTFQGTLTEVVVRSAEEVRALMSRGAAARTVGANAVNEHSSRSHYIVKVTVRGTDIITGVSSVGKLSLVDLAGSERAARTGLSSSDPALSERQRESRSINKSLSALGSVMAALSAKSSHIPYRDSKLTWLLADSLGAGSASNDLSSGKALMIVCVAPNKSSFQETLSSLKFAAKVKSVELGIPKRRFEADTTASKSEQNEQREPASVVRSVPTKRTVTTSARPQRPASAIPIVSRGKDPPARKQPPAVVAPTRPKSTEKVTRVVKPA